MAYAGESVVSASEAMQFTVALLLAALLASGLSLAVCYGARLLWLWAATARRRRRAEAALRAEIARGLAEIERFTAAQAENACPKDPPDIPGGTEAG